MTDITDPETCRETVGQRIKNAGFRETRFFNELKDGTKKSVVSHSDPENLRESIPSGNYGVCASTADELVLVDIDDYKDGVDSDALETARDELPETLTVETAHGGLCWLLRVPVDDSGRFPAARLSDEFGKANLSAPSWGEVRVDNQYSVGAGSQLDGCTKDWCDECAKPDGGRYTVLVDAPIATVDPDTLVSVLEADPGVPDASSSTGDSDTEIETETAAADDVVAPTDPMDAVDRLNAERVAEKTIVARWNDDHSSGDGVRAFYPDWDPSCGGTANVVGQDGWDDTGGAGSGGPIEMAAYDCPELPYDYDGKSSGIGPVDGADFKIAYRYLKNELGFNLPEFPSNTSKQYSTADGGGGETEAAADGGTATETADGDSPGDTSPELSPATVERRARQEGHLEPDEGLGDLDDGKKAYHAYELVDDSDEHHFLAAQPDGRLHAFEGGIWKDTGEQALRALGRDILGPEYTKNTGSELCEQVRTVDGIDRDLLGSPDRTAAVENGLLDIVTAANGGDALRDLHPQDYALVRLGAGADRGPVAYDPEADCPRWREFINESVEPARRDALQEYVGYCLLVGELPIHRAVMLVGDGQNGKSTFINVLKSLLGVENIESKTLQELNTNRFAAADLHGAVANLQADLSPTALHYAGEFKKHLGGDMVSAEQKHQDPFTYHPTAKHVYSANTVPEAPEEAGRAFFRRWLIVEFPKTFSDPGEPGPDKEPELEERLLEERSGILNWAIEGAGRLLDETGDLARGQFTAEGDPDAKQDRWVSWGDALSQFIAEGVEAGDEQYSTSEVYARFMAYCRDVLGEETDASQQQVTTEVKTVEGVHYSNSLRSLSEGDNKERGFRELAFTDVVPEVEDTDDDDSRDGALDSFKAEATDRKLREIFDGFETVHQAGGVPREQFVENAADRDRLDAETAEAWLEDKLSSGEIYQVGEDRLRST